MEGCDDEARIGLALGPFCLANHASFPAPALERLPHKFVEVAGVRTDLFGFLFGRLQFGPDLAPSCSCRSKSRCSSTALKKAALPRQLDLLVPFSGAVALSIRREPLLPEERVVGLAYPSNQLRFAGGRFVTYGADQQFLGAALMEMYAGNDRLVLDRGAPGAPCLTARGEWWRS